MGKVTPWLAAVAPEKENRFGNKRKGNFNKKPKIKKWEKEDQIIQEKVARYNETFEPDVPFAGYPLSPQTQRGLRRYLPEECTPTRIQQETIMLALQGNDILAAAKTGSGKTLGFLIPLLEILWSNRWTQIDGVGGLVLSPTRELSMQIYDVLRKIGLKHDFSAGLVTGGKSVEEEAKVISKTNIIIATPGRLCQHLDQTHGFTLDNLKAFVIDEADRMLDMGFQAQVDQIISFLPSTRQTMLFSATLGTQTSKLSRLSLKNPKYVNVNSGSKSATPKNLNQTYCIVNQEDKLNFLFSFMKNVAIKGTTKTVVFFATCKQVMHAKEVFFKMTPGVPLMRLHGKMGQHQRMATYDEFCKKDRSLLLATDLVARGMDFPNVDWVVQLDCPESVDEYIHRAGRTARSDQAGNSVLVLNPSEKKMIKELRNRKPPVNVTEWIYNKEMIVDISPKLQSLAAEREEIKGYGSRAFTAYCKSVHMAKNKKLFKLDTLDLDKIASSLGLAKTPRLRFLKTQKSLILEEKKELVKEEKNALDSEDSENDDNNANDDMFEKKAVEVDEEQLANLPEKKVKEGLSKRQKKRLQSKLLRGEVEGSVKKIDQSDDEKEDSEDEVDFNPNDAHSRLREADVEDRVAEKAMKRRKKLEAKEKSRKQAKLDVLNKKDDDEEEDNAHSDEEALNEDTNNFLSNLTFGGGDSDGSIHSDDDFESYSKRQKLSKKSEKVDFEESDEDMETEDLEALALKQLQN